MFDGTVTAYVMAAFKGKTVKIFIVSEFQQLHLSH